MLYSFFNLIFICKNKKPNTLIQTEWFSGIKTHFSANPYLVQNPEAIWDIKAVSDT